MLGINRLTRQTSQAPTKDILRLRKCNLLLLTKSVKMSFKHQDVGLRYYPPFLPSFLPFLSSFLPTILTLLHTFVLALLPYCLASFFISYWSFLPVFLSFFLSSYLPSFQPFFFPSFLPSFNSSNLSFFLYLSFSFFALKTSSFLLRSLSFFTFVKGFAIKRHE